MWMKPSTGPLLHSCVSPACTASRSFLRPKAKLRIAVELDSSASFSHPSRSSPSSLLTISANSWVSRRVSARASSAPQTLCRYSDCSSSSFSSWRMNKAATFFAVGDSPATEPALPRGTDEIGFLRASARRSWAVNRAQVSSLCWRSLVRGSRGRAFCRCGSPRSSASTDTAHTDRARLLSSCKPEVVAAPSGPCSARRFSR